MALADLLGMAAPQTNDLGFTFARPGYSAGFVDVPTPAAAVPQPAQQSDYGRGLGGFLRRMQDALLVYNGLPPMHREEARQRRVQGALQGFLANPDQAIAQLMQVDAPSAIELYTKVHPQPAADPEIIREMRAAGIDPASEEGRQILRQHIGGSSSDPSSVREYQFAKGQGFTGSYLDFLEQRGGPLIANNGDGTFTIVPRGMVSGGGAPKRGAPAVGTVEQGYRFKGGDPSKQENWEPVDGGATASTPSRGFP